MSLFSVHKRYKLGPIFLRTVSMSTLCFHTALRGQHQSSLFALKVETHFLFQFDGPGFRTEQPQSPQKSCIEGERAFLLRPTFFLRVSSDIIFTRSHLQELDAAHFYIRREN